jgi:hypothetical protein
MNLDNTAVADAPVIETVADDASVVDAPAELFTVTDFDTDQDLPAEDAGQTAADAPVVTDPPVARPDAEVTQETADAAAQPEKTDDTQGSDKLNWETAPEKFRGEYKELKQKYLESQENDLGNKFLSSPPEFQEWMKTASPTSYREIGELMATESAQAYPEKWLEYLIAEHPDMVAQMATGRDGLTLERLKAEQEYLLDDDNDNIAAIEERRKTDLAKTAKPEETPDQKRVREIIERDEQRETQAITAEVFSPIEEEIDGLVAAAGLEIKEADYAGKKFHELDDDTKFKVMANQLLPVWIDLRVKENPQLVNIQTRLSQFIKDKDKTSALSLMHGAKIAAANFADEFLELVTGQKAKRAQSDTASPTADPPPPIVKGNGSAAQVEESWDPSKAFTVRESDLFG